AGNLDHQPRRLDTLCSVLTTQPRDATIEDRDRGRPPSRSAARRWVGIPRGRASAADRSWSANMADMQAVVVIHGMGEQIPMDTIKGFVDAVWQRDDEITANGLPNPTEVWSKP